MTRATLPFAAALLLTACGGQEEAPAPEASETVRPPLEEIEPKLPPQVADFPVLASQDCVEVVEFYLEAISSREYARAALVWDDPVIDSARLEAVFGPYGEAQVEWTEPAVEGAAGSLVSPQPAASSATASGSAARVIPRAPACRRRAR